MARTQAEKEAQKRYAYKARKFYKQYPIRLHKENDKDIIDFIEIKDNFAGYIKKLIREDIKKN